MTAAIGSIPRAEMPQIPSRRLNEYFVALAELGVTVTEGMLPASALAATQAEIDSAKVAALVTGETEKSRASMGKPVLVSLDGYVLDGHHHWAAAAELGTEVPVMIVGAEIEEALELARRFLAA